MFEQVPPLSEVDVLASPDAVAAELATSVPRGEDTAALLLLDPDALSDAGRVDLLVAFERHIALLQAAQQQALASLDGRALDWSGTKLVDYTREQVGAALRLSPGTAERRLGIARTLVDRLPATLELLRTGRVTYLHAMKLAEAVGPFDDQTTVKIEQRVLPRAAEQTLAQFGASLRRAVIAVDPRRAEQRHTDAVAERRVVFTPQDDGVTELWALLPADGAAMIETALNSRASGQTDARTADQRRADALVDVFARVLGDPDLPEPARAAARHQRDRAARHAAGLRRAARRAGRVRADHRDPGTPYRRRPHRHLAAAGHRRHRPTPRLRPPHLPATGDPHRPRHRPRQNLPITGMPTPSQAVRPRPCRGVGRRRQNEQRQRLRPLRQTSPRQARRRLASQTPARREP
jgi:Domain of unknown function (DUF222)